MFSPALAPLGRQSLRPPWPGESDIRQRDRKVMAENTLSQEWHGLLEVQVISFYDASIESMFIISSINLESWSMSEYGKRKKTPKSRQNDPKSRCERRSCSGKVLNLFTRSLYDMAPCVERSLGIDSRCISSRASTKDGNFSFAGKCPRLQSRNGWRTCLKEPKVSASMPAYQQKRFENYRDASTPSRVNILEVRHGNLYEAGTSNNIPFKESFFGVGNLTAATKTLLTTHPCILLLCTMTLASVHASTSNMYVWDVNVCEISIYISHT